MIGICSQIEDEEKQMDQVSMIMKSNWKEP